MTIFDKKIFFEKSDITSANLEKTLEDLQIQENYGLKTPENYLCQGIFLRFSLPQEILHKHKIK